MYVENLNWSPERLYSVMSKLAILILLTSVMKLLPCEMLRLHQIPTGH